ncbi:hypothetical protein ACIBPB_04640 [Micromonospora sp. NPDC049836]|uniref:hypothetical protein n=1 Tax=Micromonospora sp. NPDC049836 TaxID=3364274 RepID=UPI00379B38CB
MSLFPATRPAGTAVADQARLFEAVEEALPALGPDGGGAPNNDAGALGWGFSWRMQAFLLMAEATGDPAYLHRLVEMVDAVLAVRDDRRGVRDHRELSLPVWSSAGKYTVCGATVPDEDGVPALRVHLCPPHALRATVRVVPGPDGTFTLTIVRAGDHLPIVLPELSLDPGDPRRADRVAYDRHTREDAVTVELLPGPAQVADRPRRLRAGTHRLQPARVALAAQTGMIVYPLAGLARLARERPDLVPAAVAAKTEDYLAATHEALAAHDHQWRVTDAGEGHYVWLPDEPVGFAGAELPTNEFLAVGRTLIQLAAVTGDRTYAERATAMARALRGQLTERAGGFVWPYWPSFGRVYRGWTRTGDRDRDGSHFRPLFPALPVAEDSTHALLDVDFAVLYASTPGLPEVFSAADMRTLARTFTRHVYLRRLGRRPTVRRYIGGADRPGTAHHEAQVAAWLPLHQWDPRVARRVAAVHRRRRSGAVQSVDAYCAALLARWRRP